VLSARLVVTLLRQHEAAGFTRASVDCPITSGEDVVRRTIRGGVVEPASRACNGRFKSTRQIAPSGAQRGRESIATAGDRRGAIVRAPKREEEIAAERAAVVSDEIGEGSARSERAVTHRSGVLPRKLLVAMQPRRPLKRRRPAGAQSDETKCKKCCNRARQIFQCTLPLVK
jgi:hypothetical protein